MKHSQSVDPSIVLLVQRAKGSSGFMGKGKVVNLEDAPRKKDLLIMCSGFNKHYYILNNICKYGFCCLH